MSKYIFVIFLSPLLLSCGLYSTLSFDNKSKNTIHLEYIQENGTVIKQKIQPKEDLNMMFDKKWTDENIRTVVTNIKQITICSSKDTILHVSDKEDLFNLFKKNRASLFKDRVTFKVK